MTKRKKNGYHPLDLDNIGDADDPPPPPLPKRRLDSPNRPSVVRSMLPPKKRDWIPGTPQIGLYIRFPDGAQIELVVDKNASRLMYRKTLELLHVLSSRKRVDAKAERRIAASVRKLHLANPARSSRCVGDNRLGRDPGGYPWL